MSNTEQQLKDRSYTVTEFAHLIDDTKTELTKAQKGNKWLGRLVTLFIGAVIGFIGGVLAAS